METQAQLYTPHQFAHIANVHVRTVHRWCKRGLIEHIAFEKTYRIPASALATAPRKPVTQPAPHTAAQSQPPAHVLEAAHTHGGTPVQRNGQWYIRRQRGGDHATN